MQGLMFIQITLLKRKFTSEMEAARVFKKQHIHESNNYYITRLVCSVLTALN